VPVSIDRQDYGRHCVIDSVRAFRVGERDLKIILKIDFTNKVNKGNISIIFKYYFYIDAIVRAYARISRRFLQETPQAMAAPVVNRKIREAGGFMYVMIAKAFFESYTFRDHCNALNIEMVRVRNKCILQHRFENLFLKKKDKSCARSNPFSNILSIVRVQIAQMDLLDPVPTYIYRACLLHTMEYKLAPRWNRVGLYLVEGQDFLGSTGSVNAIRLKIKEIHGTILDL